MSDDLSQETISAALATRYLGRNLIYLDVTTSSQDRARQEALAGAPEGTTIVADSQTSGHGRFQRSWVSPPGSDIYMSLILRPGPAELLKLNMVASLAVVRAVRQTTGLEARIKWPNDVQIGGRKLSGMMIDASLTGDRPDFAILGIGLNVRLDPLDHREIAEIATSLFRELGTDPGRLNILIALLGEIERLYDTVKAGHSLLQNWKRSLITLGQNVRVTWPGDPAKDIFEEGVAEDVDEEGALLLRKQDGSLARMVAGEVSLREWPPPLGGVL